MFYHEKQDKRKATGEADTSFEDNQLDTLAYLNGLVSVICLYTVFRQSMNVGSLIWQTAWPWIDVIYSLASIIVSLMILTEKYGNGTPALRVLAAITALLIWFKCLYFLRRVDQMNVTIEILF